ncbi:MAG: hypothetical protein LUE93_01455 [Bacteroides sp.]|nr:hypothetical protein [Bacteroides sp.]
MKKRTIIISAVNLTLGGPFTILKDCLRSLSDSHLSQEYQIIVLVHSRKKLPDYKNLIFIEYPASKKRWIYRLYYEYRHFKKVSRTVKPWLWLSLHDITPNVMAKRQAVYMHNPTPFNRLHIKDLLHNPIYFLFTLFYKYLYKINIRRNNYLIVQQDWLRKSFSCIFRIDPEKIIVAYPYISDNLLPGTERTGKTPGANYQFIYPAFPRPFKNFEVICQAAALLEKRSIRF